MIYYRCFDTFYSDFNGIWASLVSTGDIKRVPAVTAAHASARAVGLMCQEVKESAYYTSPSRASRLGVAGSSSSSLRFSPQQLFTQVICFNCKGLCHPARNCPSDPGLRQMGDVVGILQRNMVRMTEREASKGKGKGKGAGTGKGKGAGNAFQFSSVGKGKGKCGRGRGGYTGGYRGAAYYDTAYNAPAYDSCANDSAAHAYNESAHHGEPDAYAYDESAQHAYYGEYNEGGGDTDWSNDYVYTASSAYAVTSDPNGGSDDSFAAFSVDTNFDLDDLFDDGSHDHMGYAAEVIELSEPSGLLAVAGRALHGSAKILISAAAFAVAIAFSKPNETFVALDCLSTTVLHPDFDRGTPKNERDVALCGGEAEGGVKDDIVSENGDVDAVVASALSVSACDGAMWVNDSGATRHMVQDRRLCFNVRKAKNTSIQVADGKVLKAEYIGDAVVSVVIGIDGYGDPLTRDMLLTQVLIAPGLGHNLYSSRYGW